MKKLSEKSKEIKELIDKVRGTTPSSELQKEVEAVIKADDDKAKAKAEADKKKLDDIKAAEKKLKKDAIKEETDKKKKAAAKKKKKAEKKETGDEEEEKSEGDSEEEEDEEDTDAVIKKLTEGMEKMAEEIAALKKRKNYRTKPPKADKVDEVDDFIKQNITKDFEMVV